MSHLSASMFEIQLDLIRDHQQQLRAEAARARLLHTDRRRGQWLTSAWGVLQRLLGSNAIPTKEFPSPVVAN